MDTPGLSLFQDCESINVNNSLREEEEEELLEGEKRKQELNDLVQNAFDDLTDDDDDDDDGSSINSSHLSSDSASGSDFAPSPCRQNEPKKHRFLPSSHLEGSLLSTSGHSPIKEKGQLCNGAAGAGDNAVSMHYNHCYRTSPVGNYKNDESESEVYIKTDYNNMDQLKVLYDVRLKEIEKLNAALEDEKEKGLKLKRVVATLEKERDGALIAKKQTSEQLGRCKERISELEKKLKTCNDEIASLVKEKEEGKNDLKIASFRINELQEQISMLERTNLQKRSEKDMQSAIEALKTNHNREILNLQKQLDSLSEKYSRKEEDMNALEEKLADLEKKRAAALLERCDSNLLQEATLKALLDDANKERIEMNKKLTVLEKENEMLKNDLEQYDSVSSQRLLNSSSDDHETESILHLGLSSRGEKRRSPSSVADLNSKLKDELHRAMLGQKNKRAEIKKLQEQLRNMEVLIAQLKEHERTYLSQIEFLKANQSDSSKGADLVKETTCGVEEAVRRAISEAEATRAKEKRELMTFFDKELSRVKGEDEEKLKAVKDEWASKMDKLLSECNELKKLYLEVHSTKEQLSKKLQEEASKQKELIEEISNLKEKLSEKEQEVKRLEQLSHELIKGNEDRPKEGEVNAIEAYKNQVASLEKEVSKYKVELAELPMKQAMELQCLRNELFTSKEKLLALNNSLKKEFDNEMKKAQMENSKLREALFKKEEELKSASSRNCSPQMQDASVMANSSSKSPSKPEEVLRLKIELEHLRDTLSRQTEEMNTLESRYKAQLGEELREVERTLREQHAQEASEAERRIKDLTMKFFNEERIKLEMKYKQELQSGLEAEKQTLSNMRGALMTKEAELECLKKRYAVVEAEKNRAGEIMKKWVKEVQEIQAKLGTAEREMSELKEKFSQVKKAALIYKKKLRKHKAECNEKYENFKRDLKARIEKDLSQKEALAEEKINRVSNHYKKVIDELNLKIKGPAAT